jgi:hypothetical protein
MYTYESILESELDSIGNNFFVSLYYSRDRTINYRVHLYFKLLLLEKNVKRVFLQFVEICVEYVWLAAFTFSPKESVLTRVLFSERWFGSAAVQQCSARF